MRHPDPIKLDGENGGCRRALPWIFVFVCVVGGVASLVGWGMQS